MTLTRSTQIFLAISLLTAALFPTSLAQATPLVERSSYDALLAAYAREGGVNYKGLAKDRASLEAFVASLADVSSDTVRAAAPPAKTAFWINAYNAIMLLTVVERYPLPDTGARAIEDAWSEERWRIAGETLSLNGVKHAKLIKELQEPRTHFAVALASRGGPPLKPGAYQEETISEALDSATREFLADESRFRVEFTTGTAPLTSGTVYLSQVFKWFGDDFVAKYAPPEQYARKHGAQVGACLNFIALNVPPETQQFLRQGDLKVEFLPFDWRLNEAPPLKNGDKPPTKGDKGKKAPAKATKAKGD